MATYDLVCTQCGRPIELYVQGFLEPEDKRCPSCGSLDVEQKFTSFLTGLTPSDGCAAPKRSGFG